MPPRLPIPNEAPARTTAVIHYTPEGIAIDTPTGESGDTALAVHIEHLHQTPWLHPFISVTAISDTLNGAVAVNAKTIIVNDATGFTIGDCINISPPGEHLHVYREIIVIDTNTFTLDAGLDTAFVNASVVTKVLTNMAVNGAVTPVIFSVHPSTNERVDIVRLLFSIECATAPDDSAFGDLTALTNGVHVRRNTESGTEYLTLGVWKANKDMKLNMYNVDYTAKAGPSTHGVNGRWSIFDGTGAVLNIDELENESIEFVIQDDLSGLAAFSAVMQGHIEI